MGTSNAYEGAAGGTPLIPRWLDDEESNSGNSSAPTDGQPESGNDDGVALAVPPAPKDKPVLPVPGAPDRFTSARSNFTRFARSGGDDRKSLGRAVSHYVSKSSGGSHQAARRMGASRGAAAGLVGFLNNASANGIREALRSLNLESLAGRPIEEVFAGLAEYICPDGGSIDEGIARDAFIETIADLAEAGITDIDGLTPDQIQTVFELYATHAIEARLCNDIGTKLITMPSDARTVERVEDELRDFIQRGVSDALNSANVNLQSLAPEAVMEFVTNVYQSAFEILQIMGEEEAAR